MKVIKILKESIPSDEQKIAELDVKYKQADDEEKDKILQEYLTLFNNPSLNNIADVIKQSIENAGMSPKRNQFMHLLGNLDFNISKQHERNFLELFNMSNNGRKMRMGAEYLKNKELYDRNLEDFHYTVFVMDATSTSSNLRKYFKNIDNIEVEELFINGDKSKPKPVGKKPNQGEELDLDTLRGVVTSWEDGGDNVASDEEETKKTTKQISKNQDNLKTYKSVKDIKTSPSEKIGTKVNVTYVYAGDNKWVEQSQYKGTL